MRRVLGLDGQALATAMQRLNQVLLPGPSQLAATQAEFGEALRWPNAGQLFGKIASIW